MSSGDLLKAEVMSGSYRGDTLYGKISEGERVSNEVVDDLIGEAMMWTAGGSDVRFNEMYLDYIVILQSKLSFTKYSNSSK